jgi:hypothetical protein
VTLADDGSFVVVWSSYYGQDGSGSGVFGRRFDSAGAAIGDEFGVNTYTADNQSCSFNNSISARSDSGFAVAWTSTEQDGSDGGVYGQLFGSDGSSAGTEFQVNSTTLYDQRSPSVAMLAGGGFAIAWESQQDAAVENIYCQIFDSSGEPIGSEFLANVYTGYRQISPSIRAYGDVGFILVWGSENQDGAGWGVYAQRFAADGTPMGALPW